MNHLGPLLLLCSVGLAPVLAAPPVVNYLYPPGGQRGTTLDVTLDGTFARWPVQVWTDDPLLNAKCSTKKGVVQLTIDAATTPGTHWFRVADAEGASALRPFIVGTLPNVLEQEPNDTIAAPQTITASSVVNGRLGKVGDVDVYAFALKQGETLVASLVAHQTFRAPIDAILQITSPDGAVLEQNNDHAGLDPQVTFTAPRDGIYRVRVFAFPATPDSAIRFFGSESSIYRLTLTKGGFIDYAVPLAVTRDTKAAVTLVGWNIPPASTHLTFTAKGTRELLTPASLANTVSLLVEDHPCINALTERPGTLAPPFSLTGRLQKPTAKDVFTVNVNKGQVLTVRVDSAEIGLGVTPVVRVLNGANVLARAEPASINKDVSVNYTPTQDGPVQVEVSDLYQQANARSIYRLRIAPPDHDVTLSVANDRFAVPLDKPLDVPITVAWRGGPAKELIVRAEGLPPGLTMDIVPPKSKDEKTIVCRFHAKEAGTAGAFRLRAEVKDQPTWSRTVTAPITELETITADLWISGGGSVPPPAKPKKK